MTSGAKPKKYPKHIVDEVSRLYAQNMTQTEIAKQLNTTQKIVWNLMRRHGIKARVAAKRNQYGENNASWKGDKAGYAAFHRRLYAAFGKPTKCAVCNTEESDNYDYANLSGEYQNIDDYLPMCRSCHWQYDNKILNIKHMKEKLSGRKNNAGE